GIRSLISIPAGLYAMPIGMFTLLTAAGSAIWNSVFVTIGYYMGSNWTVIEPYTDIFSDVVYAAVALVVAVFVVRLILRERRRRRLGLPEPGRAHLEELETGAAAEQSEERCRRPTATTPGAAGAPTRSVRSASARTPSRGRTIPAWT